jgi:predicted nucleotidyltransferase
MLIDDIDLIAFSTPEFDIFIKNQEDPISLKIQMADGQNDENYTVNLSMDTSIFNLKRLILFLNGNKPFFLEKSLTNDEKLSDLISDSELDQAQIKIFQQIN